MKKITLTFAIAIVLLLTSCSSGWSCKSSYCNAKQAKKIEQKKNA
jgi:protein involved in sex pheromone biosynthesis